MEAQVMKLVKSRMVINLIYLRNKNQHRVTQWWRWLSLLKRCIGKLVRELQDLNLTRANARTTYMADLLVPQCYISFSQVVHDNQFSALGLVLVAELARIQWSIDILSGCRESPVVPLRNTGSVKSVTLIPPAEDIGEALSRNSQDLDISLDPPWEAPLASGDATSTGLETAEAYYREVKVSNIDAEGAVKKPTIEAIQQRPCRSKKRKRTNAIDELFHGME